MTDPTLQDILNEYKLTKMRSQYDDINCSKVIVFQSDGEDDCMEGNKLTSMVRQSYVNYLRRLLNKNYKTWCENYQNSSLSGEGKRLTSSDIETCVKYLEQKALRKCMIASIYRQAMIKMMSEIKKKTKEMKLFSSLNRCEERDKFVMEKSTQTAFEQCNKQIQTEITKTRSLLDLPLPDPKELSNSLSDTICRKTTSDSSSAAVFLKETVAKVSPQPRLPLNLVNRERKRALNDSIVQDRSKKMFEVENSIANNMLLSELIGNVGETYSEGGVGVVDRIPVPQPVPKPVPKPVSKPEIQNVRSSHSSAKDENMSTLDDRLAEMGLLNFDDNQSDNGIDLSNAPLSGVRGHSSSWYVEMTSHYCNYRRRFNSLSTKNKARLKKKLKKLFGSVDSEDEDECRVNEEKLAICRKRTANMVVAELTPYFGVKISTRELFKEFAKRTTDAILLQNYSPDSNTVNKFVTDYFNKHDSVTSMEDIDF